MVHLTSITRNMTAWASSFPPLENGENGNYNGAHLLGPSQDNLDRELNPVPGIW